MLSGLTPHHVCFAVDDLERSATTMARGLGAGPFFRMPHAPFDELIYGAGEPCTWRHEHAFGSFGGQTIELTQTLAAAPAELATAFARKPVNHIGYTAPDLDVASERLVGAGARRFLRGKRGPVRMAYHEVPALGCIELLQADEIHDRFAAVLAACAADWDGSQPFRTESPF